MKLNSFHLKLTGLFVLLAVLILGAGSLFGLRAIRGFSIETEQRLNRNLATVLADEFQPYLEDSIDRKMIEMEIERISGYNPRIETYLLGSNGMIKAAFPDNVEGFVDVAPLRAYMALMVNPPFLGPDPRRPGSEQPFSVAPVTIMGEQGCFVYVILGGEMYETIAGPIRQSYLYPILLSGLLVLFVSSALIAFALSTLFTRRLRAMQLVVQSFQGGDRTRRVASAGSDEITALGQSFNSMADTIDANISRLERADLMRRELVANVSHDLRSPLASISGYLETILIKNESLSAQDRQKYLEIGLRNTQKLSKLVDDLFELSKLDAMQIEPELVEFSLAELVHDIVLQYEPQAQEAQVQLEIDAPGRIATVHADIALVDRVISNLVENAIKHTPAGGKVRIVPSNENASWVSVKVIDTGNGIPADDLPYIFERFYKVDKSRGDDARGTGLGLAIAKKIIELHGGTLSVMSAANVGTTFSFQLPRKPTLV